MFILRKRCGFYCRPVTQPDKTGRARAAARYAPQPCEVCGMAYGGRGRVQRHHRDSNRLNNDRVNIAFLCVQHHKDAHRVTDGKLGGGPRPRVAALLRDRAMAQAEIARQALTAGQTPQGVAAAMGVNPWTVYRWLRKYR